MSRSPIVTAGDDEDGEENAANEEPYAGDASLETRPSKSILKVCINVSGALR